MAEDSHKALGVGMHITSEARIGARTSASRSSFLSLLWSLLLGVVMFVYTALDTERFFPPVQPLVHGMVVLVLGCWWGWKVIRREWLVRSPLALPLVALLGVATLSTIWSVDQRRSLDGLLFQAALVFGFFLVCDVLAKRWQPELIIHAMLVLTTLLLFQGLWVTWNWHRQWYDLQVPEYPLFLLPYRLFGVADWPTHLAANINLTLPFAILKLAKTRSWRSRLPWLLWLLLATVVLFWTRARGATIGTAVLLTIMIGWLIWERRATVGRSVGRWVFASRWIWGTALAYVTLFTGLHAVTSTVSTSKFNTHGGGLTADRSTFWSVAIRDFLAHPVVGSGPRTYARAFVEQQPATRAWIPPNAHSLYIDALAQQGVLGFGALTAVLVAGGLALWRGWQAMGANSVHREARAMLVGVAAATAAYLTHSVFEVVNTPTNATLIVALAALGIGAAGALHVEQSPMSRWVGLTLVVPIVLFGVLQREATAQTAMLQGIAAAFQDDWTGAARALDQAVEVDPDFAFYYGQRGYAYGRLARSAEGKVDPEALRRALDSYSVALEREPSYVPNLLNASALYLQVGDRSRAEASLATGVARGRDWALPALLLADQYVDAGRAAEAEELFVAAFASESQAREMVACRRSTACQAAAERQPQVSNPLRDIHSGATTLIAQGRAWQALALLAEVPVHDRSAIIWLDRSAAHLALGELPQADYTLKMAYTLGAGSADLAAPAALVQAKLALARSNPGAAIAALEQVVQPNLSEMAYSLAVFRRIALPGPLLPEVAVLQRTAADHDVLMLLADLYMEQQRPADAMWARQEAQSLGDLLGAADGR